MCWMFDSRKGLMRKNLRYIMISNKDICYQFINWCPIISDGPPIGVLEMSEMGKK